MTIATQKQEHSPSLSIHEFKHGEVGLKSPKPQRPSHRRRKSTRFESVDFLRELRYVFQRGLTKSWGTPAEFKALARNFFATSIGLSSGHLVRHFTLNQFQTALLAVEVSRIINTADVILINDPLNEVLVIAHTHMLSRRIDDADKDSTIFLLCDDGKPTTVPHTEVAWLQEARSHIKTVLRNTNDQVIQLYELGWAPELAKQRMLTINAWLIESPVCYVFQDDTVTDHPITERLAEETFWSFSFRLDGHDPENDHTFDQCQIPASLFLYDPHPNESLAGRSSSNSLIAVQDKMQTAMFHRLNNSETAARIWSDVSIEFQAIS